MFEQAYKITQPAGSVSLHQGEYHLPKAPVITLANGENCTPQHFFGFEHTLDSVEALLACIEFSAAYPIFVSIDQAGLFLQVGVVGTDNYLTDVDYNPSKIVYGRKWRVEPNLPTSEIIQTTFLAIKKAREHELRELFTLADKHSSKTSTPFNCHQDLPLMARHSELFKDSASLDSPFDVQSIQALLALLKVGGRNIRLVGFYKRLNNYLLDLSLDSVLEMDARIDGFNELDDVNISLILTNGSLNELLYQLMDELLKLSDRFVEENFRFKGFARFSRQQSIASLGRFSINTRHVSEVDFDQTARAELQAHNYLVDESRVPVILNEAQKKRLQLLAK